MAADFNKPVITDSYIENYGNIRDNNKANALMFNGISVTNIPVGAIQYASGVFNKWGGASWSPELLTIAGGGTGASTASGARAALGTDNAANITNGTMDRARLPVATDTLVGVSRVINDLITGGVSDALSAAQGVTLGLRTELYVKSLGVSPISSGSTFTSTWPGKIIAVIPIMAAASDAESMFSQQFYSPNVTISYDSGLNQTTFKVKNVSANTVRYLYIGVFDSSAD